MADKLGKRDVSDAEARKSRLAAQLRENLRKRKAQARARKSGGERETGG
jgi:hypothetical protein